MVDQEVFGGGCSLCASGPYSHIEEFMESSEQRILLGNEAIGRGIVESGCTLAASYPGTPSSEILGAIVAFARETGTDLHTEWSTNEKVAFEVALANSMAGKRSAVSMKQVGLNVAADPLMRSAYLGVKGGMVVVVADDPGPYSSQTEQDSRFFAQFAKIPVLDPVGPQEAKEMVGAAFELSERYEIPVMLRPTIRICHGRQNVSCEPPRRLGRTAHFEKDRARWAATPRFIEELHRSLNEKIDAIAGETAFFPAHIAGTGSLKDAVSSPRVWPMPTSTTCWRIWGYWGGSTSSGPACRTL